MKPLHLFLLALPLLAACSADEQTDPGAPAALPISFTMASQGTTRATEATVSTMKNDADGFRVRWAKNNNGKKTYIGEAQFKWDASRNFFVSSPEYAYPDGTETTDFYALYPYATTIGSRLTDNPGNIYFTYSPATNAPDQKDLMVAVERGRPATDNLTGTTLKFQHLLSQIELKVDCASTSIYTYYIESAKICGIYGQGSYETGFSDNTSATSFDISSQNSWTALATKSSYSISTIRGVNNYSYISLPYDANYNGRNPISLNHANIGNVFMVLPQTLSPWAPSTDKTNTTNGAYVEFNLCINYDGDGYFADGQQSNRYYAAVPISGTWLPGKRYVYTFDFTKGPGRFSPTSSNKPGETILGEITWTVSVSNFTESTTYYNEYLQQ